MSKKINRWRLRLQMALADERGEVSFEYIAIASGLLVLVYGAFSFLGIHLDTYIRGLPGLLGF